MAVLSFITRGNINSPAVLFLHGFAGCADDWAECMDDLSSDFFCIAADLPGHGSTGILSAEMFEMPRTAELALALLDELAIEKAHLAAYSMGGRIGLYLLVHYPDRFSTAVLESCSPGLSSESERGERRRSDGDLADEILSGDLKTFFESWYAQPLFDLRDRNPELYNQLVSKRSENTAEGLALSLRRAGQGSQPDLRPDLPNIPHQLLFVAGARDRKYSALARTTAGLCPHGDISIIEDCGHCIHAERPREYRNLLHKFLKG
jgi:2-succinyl-6-hydroxy-2,4-cyclohexadiene-1-carboxylate synthase